MDLYIFFSPIDLDARLFSKKKIYAIGFVFFEIFPQKLFNLWWTFKQEKSRWSKNKLSDFSQILKILSQNYDSCNLFPPPLPFSVAHFSSPTFQLLHKSRNINQLPFSLISSNLVSFPQNPKSLSRSTSKDSFRPKNEKKKKKRIKQKKLFLIQKFLLL